MKKILFLDPFSLTGHVNFNAIYLNALSANDVQIDVVFKENYINLNTISKIGKIIEIPTNYYSNLTGVGIVSRSYMFLQLLYVRRNVDLNNYDIIIMSSYEEISLFFSLVCRYSSFFFCWSSSFLIVCSSVAFSFFIKI